MSNPFITNDAAVAYNHFAPIVASTPPEQLSPWKGGADIIRINVERVLEAIGPELAAVVANKLPGVKEAEIREMPTLALALTYADDRVVDLAAPEIQKRQKAIRPLRRFALMQLQIFAFQGLVPAERVDGIAAGQGAIDEANDCIAIPEVFKEFDAAVSGKHPFTTEQMKELSTAGNWLKARLKIPGAEPGDKAPVNGDALVRDQLYAELKRRYEDAYKVAVEIWGRNKVDENIPTLLSRVRAAPKPKQPSAPTEKQTTASGATGTGTSIGGGASGGEPGKNGG